MTISYSVQFGSSLYIYSEQGGIVCGVAIIRSEACYNLCNVHVHNCHLVKG